MAITDWNFGAHGPEILVDVGTVGLQRTISYPMLTADFGSGYYAAVITGDNDGDRTWKCVWSGTRHDKLERPGMVIPIYDDGTIVEGPSAGLALSFGLNEYTGEYVTNASGADMQSRMKYMQRFFHRWIQRGGLPFVFVDPAEAGGFYPTDPYDYSAAFKWLARFQNPTTTWTQSGKNNIWNFSADIVSVRPGYY